MIDILPRGRGIRLAALLTGLAAGFSATGAQAQQSLADSMVKAYLSSPELAGSRADVKVQSERAVQARAGGRLRVDGQASAEAEWFENNPPGSPFIPDNRYDWAFPTTVALNLTQPLYTGGRVENATAAAESRIDRQKAGLTATEQRLLLSAVTAFMNVRRDAEFVSLGVNNVKVLTEQLRAANERFEVGEVTRTDVEQARARLAAAQSRLAAARGSLAASREDYLRAVGEPAGDLLPPPPLPQLPGSQDEATAIALQSDPGVIAARLERDAAGSDVRAAIGGLLPEVSLQARVESVDSDRDGTRRREAASVGIFINIPIYSGGANYSSVREAQAFVEGAEADINASMRAAALNVGRSWADLQVARASIKAGQLEVSAAQLAFEGVREEAKLGARTTLDVLDAEQEVLNARANLVGARRDEYVAAYSVLASIGMLTVEHLGLDVEPQADVASYYETVRDRNFGYDDTDDTVWQTQWRP